MSLPLADISESVQRLEKSITADLAGQIDFEGRSPLDLLIEETRSQPRGADQVACVAIRKNRQRQEGWWGALERFVVLAVGCQRSVGSELENALQERKIEHPKDRASAYAMLDFCGKPATASVVKNDSALRHASPLLWLDLMVAKVPQIEEAQALVLSGIAEGFFGLDQFVQRLDEMRSIGGSQLGAWMRRIRQLLPNDDAVKFDEIVAEAFGAGLNVRLNNYQDELSLSRLPGIPIMVRKQLPSGELRYRVLGKTGLNIERIKNTKKYSDLAAAS